MNIEQLEKIARYATPGPWAVDVDPRPGMGWNREIIIADRPYMTVCFMAHSSGKDTPRDGATAAHIAAFSPTTVLKLLAVVRAAHSALASLDECAMDVSQHAAADCLREAIQSLAGETK